MADNTHMYREIKDALKNQIQSYLNSLGEQVDVYPVPYESIALFPAVALELNSRRKPKVGVGVKRLELSMNIWVYTDILDVVDAEGECLRILEIVEDAVESDKKLGGVAHDLTIDDEAGFGTVRQGEANFLQGARLPVTVYRRFN